jgi:hypothetical protein
MVLLGTWFMRYVAASKASSQNLSGMCALANKERPTLTKCLYFLSVEPFC